MNWRLFIDDERFPATEDWKIARSSVEAIELCQKYGFPSYISFDHDLGGDDTSINFIYWMIDAALDTASAKMSVIHFPKDYFVHSQNPVGAANIKSLMDSFISYINES